MTKKYENAFIIYGFRNWKKAGGKFERHQASECNKEVVLRLKCFQAPIVIDQLESQAVKTQLGNIILLLKQLSSLQFLL